MKRFLAVYMGTPEARAAKEWDALPAARRAELERKGIDAWLRWAGEHAGAIVEQGGPLGRTKRTDASGVADARNAMCGYVIIEAPSHEAAARLFAGHPHFSIFPGESVEIMECLPIPRFN